MSQFLAALLLAGLLLSCIAMFARIILVWLDYPNVPGLVSFRNFLDRTIGLKKLSRQALDFTALGLVVFIGCSAILAGVRGFLNAMFWSLIIAFFPEGFRALCKFNAWMRSKI